MKAIKFSKDVLNPSRFCTLTFQLSILFNEKIFILLLFIASIAVNAQTKAPVAVATAFAKQFPDATNVKWGKENAKEYEANFLLKGMKMSANYDLQGNWKETETEIAVKDLPEAVMKSIHEKYSSAIISAADKIEWEKERS